MDTQASDPEPIQNETPDDTEFEHINIQDSLKTETDVERFLNKQPQVKETREKIQINTVPEESTKAVPSKDDENKIEELFGIIKSIQNDRGERAQIKADDFDVFGDLVARKLRGLSTRYAQCTVQNLIHNLLYEAEIGKYDVPNRISKPYL